MRDFMEFMSVMAGAVFGGLAFLVAVAATIATITGPRVCNAKWGDRAEWGFWSGCMVETNRGMIPAEKLNGHDLGIILQGSDQ